MQDKIKSLAMICVALIGLTGCNDTPKGVIQSAGKALKEDNLKDFRRTLTKEMATQYGNSTAMAKLKKVLTPFSDFNISKGSVTDSLQSEFRICNPAGWHTVETVDIWRAYEVEIGGIDASGTVTPLWNANVECEIYYAETNSHKNGPCYERNGQFCQISALK